GSRATTTRIIADELDTALDKVKVEQAPANPGLYANPGTKTQSYGGSRGVRDHIEMWRKSAAAAREMLKQAAANEWGVPVDQVDTEPDTVIHKPSGRKLPYGQLVDKAQALPVPQNPKLKTPDQFRYIGKMVKRRDTPEKVNGKGVYGMDVVLPGMLVASVERCPVNNGKVKSFDATATKQITGETDHVHGAHERHRAGDRWRGHALAADAESGRSSTARRTPHRPVTRKGRGEHDAARWRVRAAR